VTIQINRRLSALKSGARRGTKGGVKIRRLTFCETLASYLRKRLCWTVMDSAWRVAREKGGARNGGKKKRTRGPSGTSRRFTQRCSVLTEGGKIGGGSKVVVLLWTVLPSTRAAGRS